MAYQAQKEGTNYAVYQDGKRVSTTSAQGLTQYGLSESQLSTPTQQTTTTTPQETFNGYYTTGALAGQTAQGATTQSGYGTTTTVPQQQTQTGVYQATSSAPDPFSQNISYGAVNQQPQQANQQTNQTKSQPTSSTSQVALTMPATGSVVDLLNQAGAPSDFNSRTQLAGQFGIQGYRGTAAQNQELAKKYLDFYNSKQGTEAPNTNPMRSPELQGELGVTDGEDPVSSFLDIYAGMNPIESNIFQQLSGLLSSTQNQQSLTDFYKQEIAAQGIPELNMELADINRIMEGTEDDIRQEIEKVSGFATESQVQAMTGARNKGLLRKANYLSNVLNAKNEYVDRIVSLTQADRKTVSEELDRKLGITKTLFDMSQQMTNAARESYMSVVKTLGWGALAESVKNNPSQQKRIESVLGLSSGDLGALAAYKKPLTEIEAIELENKRLQNQKLYADLNATTPVASNVMKLATAQSNITSLDSLLNDSALGSAVGPNMLARGLLSPANLFTGAKSNFIAGVQQITSQLTLDKLIQAKQNGATFGSLTEGERAEIASAASKIGSYAIKDKAGNVIGYKASEQDFKKELDKINNFAKMDFILKGGDAAIVGVLQMDDGTFWTRNSDGSLTQLM